MNRKHLSLFLLSFYSVISMSAQFLSPVTRFHAEDNPYINYTDNFLSGFVQSADVHVHNGFLQTPFVGDPILIYVGEKDSTQYTAYASGYEFKHRAPETGRYYVDMTRYGITARLEAFPAYTIQEYVFPDTIADKGFLINLDHALTGVAKEDMDVQLIDKYTLRASKPAGTSGAQLYYYAQFSHPFSTWNIRRERVKLENGKKEARCIVALTFLLNPQDKLVVASSVSKISSDEAYALLDGHAPERHEEALPANTTRTIYRFDKSNQNPNARYTPRKKKNRGQQLASQRRPSGSKQTGQPQHGMREEGLASYPYFVDVTTREADLRAAFYSALSLLMQQPEFEFVNSADEFLAAAAPLYRRSPNAQADEQQTDALLHEYAKKLFAGGNQRDKKVEAAWYVCNALGFRPAAMPEEYIVVRPVFNIVNLYLSNGRRLMMHVKNNGPKNIHVEQVSLMHKPVAGEPVLTHEQVLRGGTMEVKMTCPE